MTSSVSWLQTGDPVALDFVSTQPPAYTFDPPTREPMDLDSLTDVAGTEDGAVGDVLTKDSSGSWGPSAPSGGVGTEGGTSFHHVQLSADEVWTIEHSLGFNPSGIVAHDSIGDILEPADIVYVSSNVLQLLFTGRPLSGTADLS